MAAVEVKALLLLLLLLPARGLARVDDVYFKEGGELRLRPPPRTHITVLVWKIRGSLAAEWTAGSEQVFYRAFEGRSSLDTGTGALTVRDATPEFAGEYRVEINNLDVTDVSWLAKLIKDVPVPRVEVKPLACSETSGQCSLVCAGNTSEAGPVTYEWRRDDGDWVKGEATLLINNNDEIKGVKEFRCRMENPVGHKDSEPVRNPFTVSTTPGVNVTGAVVGSLVALVAVGLAAWFFISGKYRSYFRVSQGDRPAAAP